MVSTHTCTRKLDASGHHAAPPTQGCTSWTRRQEPLCLEHDACCVRLRMRQQRQQSQRKLLKPCDTLKVHIADGG